MVSSSRMENWRAATIEAGARVKVPPAPTTRALRRLTVRGAAASRSGLNVIVAAPAFGPPLMNSMPLRTLKAMRPSFAGICDVGRPREPRPRICRKRRRVKGWRCLTGHRVASILAPAAARAARKGIDGMSEISDRLLRGYQAQEKRFLERR